MSRNCSPRILMSMGNKEMNSVKQMNSTSQMNSIAAVLQHWATITPNAALLIAPETERQLTYQDVLTQTQALAKALHKMDVSPGAHIGLVLPNGLQTSSLFLSVMAAGYVVTPFNLLAQTEQLSWVMNHSDCAVIFYGPGQSAIVNQAARALQRPCRLIEIDPDAQQIDFEGLTGTRSAPMGVSNNGLGTLRASQLAVNPEQPALLMYTSGTTGIPKGVRLTHQNLLHAAESVSKWHQLTPEDRVLSSLPIYHINGQSIATVTPFYSGGSIVCAQKFSASQWWPTVSKYRCTWINMVPTIIAYLLNASEDGRTPSWQELQSLRFGRSASAPLPPEHHRAFEERFGVPVIEAMGMTESASVVFCNPHDSRRRYGSPGLPCGVEAKVIAPDGRTLASGETGELCLSGANVMAAYYKAEIESAKAFDTQGWLKTGDLGFRDSDGFYFVTGRLKELIIKGGENIAPREIDEMLLRHPAVLDAACVGIPDPNYGQEILACIILREGERCSESDIREFCLEKLGRYKTPKSFQFVNDLPRGPSGKVQRLKLLELL